MSTTTMQAQAQQTITDSVLKNTHLLIEALKDNYRQYSIRGHQRSVERNESVEHHQQRIDELRNGILPIDYVIESGKKYHKIIMVDSGSSRSVHAFVDKKTGEVYKSASWKSPAKGVRFDLRVINQREWLFAHADWAGSYLYAR
jgi:hypothetical protein